MAKEWYRHETWSEQDREEFYAKFKRAQRGYNKAQYAGIQALHLAQTGDPELARVALELIKLVEAEDPGQMTRWMLTKAAAFNILNEVESAVEAYRAAIQCLRDFPSQRVQSEIEFAYFVVRKKLRHLYQEALDAIDEFAEAGLFAVQAYNHHLLKAVILNELGKTADARQHAALALEASKIVHSGLSHHPNLGLVDFSRDDKINPRRELHAVVVQLAQATPVPAKKPGLWRILDTIVRKKP